MQMIVVQPKDGVIPHGQFIDFFIIFYSTILILYFKAIQNQEFIFIIKGNWVIIKNKNS